MFTGLVQCMGEVLGLRARGATGAVLAVRAPRLAAEGDPLVLGESVATDGACLTVTAVTVDGFEAEVLEETLRCTMLGDLRPGDRVNLERALRLGDRLGGHIVSGHVDEVGRLLAKRPEGADFRLRFACSPDFARGVVRKGSVAVAGVSLTVAALGGDWFEVAAIPTTLRETVLGGLPVGGRANLEADLIGAYVRRALGQAPLSLEQLIAAGFAD